MQQLTIWVDRSAYSPQCCLRGQLHPGVLLEAISTPAGSHSHAEHLGGHVLLVANLVRQRSPSVSLRIRENDKLSFDYFGRQFAFCLLRGEHIRGHRGELVDEPGAGYFFSIFLMKYTLTINKFLKFCALVRIERFRAQTHSKYAIRTQSTYRNLRDMS